MQAIGGACRLDGGPVDRAMVGRMNDAAQLLLPCRRRSWTHGSSGLCCASPHLGAAGPAAAEPAGDASRRRTLVFDGRLDNREDLVAELRRHGARPGSSDVELTLAAYAAWGDDCASKLIGDFAFALWDAARRRLLCVRDPLGVRPLYMGLRDDVVCFATQIRQILAARPHTPAFDLEFVADRLAHGVDRADAACTPYRGVSRLKPGHRLIAEDGRVRIERYWEWSTGEAAADRDLREYVDRFRETFSSAVASRMRGVGRVWSDLSGGLDSSSIVSVAARRRGGPRLSAISVVFDRSTLSDERQWAATVARTLGVDRHCIDGDAQPPFTRLTEAVRYWEEPHAAAAFFGVHRQYQRLMGGAGVPILLTGIGAEAVVMSKQQSPVHLADLARRGRLAALWRELDRWQRALGIPLGNVASRYCLRPLGSRPLVSHGRLPEIPDWIAGPFARRWNLQGRARNGSMPPARRGVADQWHVERVGRISGFLLRGCLEKACDIRYPFLHRPLVELALATPWSLKAVPGETKALLRRAMEGVLPEEVRRRTQNASTGHAAYTGLRREWPILERIVASSMLADLGAVDRERLRNALHLARQGHAFDLGGLLSTLTLDAWLQHAARKGDSAWLS